MEQLSAWSKHLVNPTILVGSFMLSLVAVWAIKRAAPKIGFIDRCNSNTDNPGGAAMGGGVAVVFVLVVMVLLLKVSGSAGSRIATAVVSGCLLGIIDDVVPLRPGIKFIGQCVCVGLYLLRIDGSGSFLLLAGLFLLLAVNAWNLVDVMDGLLGWIGTISLLGVSTILLISGRAAPGLESVGFVAAGSLAGFLVWNKHPAKVLLGDAGSLPLGMLYGTLVVESVTASPKLGMSILLPGFIPFFEVGFLVIQRTKKGIPFYHTSPDHFALRLKRNGFSVQRVIKFVIIAGTALSVFAGVIVASAFNRVVVGGVIGIVAVNAILAYRFLNQLSTDKTT